MKYIVVVTENVPNEEDYDLDNQEYFKHPQQVFACESEGEVANIINQCNDTLFYTWKVFESHQGTFVPMQVSILSVLIGPPVTPV